MNDPVLESLIARSGGGRRGGDAKYEDLDKRPPAERAAILRLKAASDRGEGYSETVAPQPPQRLPAPLMGTQATPDPVLQSLMARSGGASINAEPSIHDIPGMPQRPPEASQPEPKRWLDRILSSLPGAATTAANTVMPGMGSAARALIDPSQARSAMQSAAAPAETALALGTGAVAGIAAPIAGAVRTITEGKIRGPESERIAQERAKEVRDSLTYQPRTEGARENLSTIQKGLEASKLPPFIGPEITLASIAAGPRAVAKSAPANAANGALGSVGAAGAGTIEQARALVANSSPELRAAVESAAKAKNATVDIDALKRHVEAHSLPVPVNLTPGQATQDVSRLSFEKNRRGTDAKVADRFSEQNKTLSENLNRIRENAAPDVYVSSKPDIGNLVIDAYKAKDDALNTAISTKYQALRDANGGSFPLDAKAFVSTADKALHKELLYDHVSPEIRRTIDRLATSGMTFENFEALRTNLARIQRSVSADGNAKAAAGVIRDALEALPMPKGAEHLKPLADAARAAAKERFSMIEADPAYKAVTRGTASAEKFVDQFVIRSDLKKAEAAINNLDPTARQAVRAGVIKQLQESAGIVNDAGNFSQAGYNKALERVRPKLGLLFDVQERQHLEALGNVARYTQAQPVGSFVNNSNTLVGGLAEMAKAGAKSTVEGAANVAAKGIPIGSFARSYLEKRAIAKQTDEILRPGGGILLRDVPK